MNRAHITLLSVSMIVVATLFFLFAKKTAIDRLDNISCRSRYDVFLGVNSLNSTIVISMIKGKGTLSLIGDYYTNRIQKTPVRIYSSFASSREGQMYSVKMLSSMINPSSLMADPNFINMLNTSMFKKNNIAVYKILQQRNGNYVFISGDAIYFTCKSTR
ncbi:hypothetical protein [Enterobacter sp. MGH 16]|uniref:hypothetical protein n=1 Tax=Enterobacter cloacae complex TaxID=354276 RepID=UPI0003BEB4AA|nr:hypothetical protein [Enterobacter sp. MGH 16]ESN53161.1 hypothetical protein L362_00058 [Enterobacter sp. MGH 16]